MNAQITFLDGTLSLIHIPLPLYSTFLQPILQILLPPSQPLPSPPGRDSSTTTIHHHHQDETTFLNISITPLECSIVCPSSWARTVFEPAIARLPKDQAKTISVSKDAYAVFSVISAGMDAGSRVVDLTCPLALAGIPIFFITTYYSDFILVPTKDRRAVVETLRAKGGFVFVEEDGTDGGENGFDGYGYGSRRGSVTMTAGMGYHHTMGISGGSGGISGLMTPITMPTTPPPSDAGELQLKTFETLKRRNVVPFVEPGLRLVHCSGREKTSIHGGGGGEGGRGHGHSGGSILIAGGNGTGYGGESGGGGDANGGGGYYPRRRRNSWIDTVDTKLYTSIISALVSQPRFLSVTLAQDDPPSLLLDKALVDMFGDSLVGPTEGTLVPIFLDLVNLPFEATGIVSGVAGRLVKDMSMAESAELSYLSTARAGAVILSREQAVTALGILEPLLKKQG